MDLSENKEFEVDTTAGNVRREENRTNEVLYNTDKDFYRGLSGELRLKAEGLFKKAKEKGISIEEIDISTLRQSQVDFPGIGCVELPAYVVKVRGRDIQSQQVMADGKQIDYYNRYQKYLADKIAKKNTIRDSRGRIVRENSKPVIKQEADFTLNEWEMFEIGRDLVGDKEFGLEKTITGACDRVIRKLMGENDWLDPEEARMLDEEFNNVQNAIANEKGIKKQGVAGFQKRATDRQINYFKARIRNSGLDPENEQIIKEILRHAGLVGIDINTLTTSHMSKLIDNMGDILPKVKDAFEKRDYNAPH
jgi:hypothetical protein